jgi:hypothetical protein
MCRKLFHAVKKKLFTNDTTRAHKPPVHWSAAGLKTRQRQLVFCAKWSEHFNAIAAAQLRHEMWITLSVSKR